jgi:hypothetical protein
LKCCSLHICRCLPCRFLGYKQCPLPLATADVNSQLIHAHLAIQAHISPLSLHITHIPLHKSSIIMSCASGLLKACTTRTTLERCISRSVPKPDQRQRCASASSRCLSFRTPICYIDPILPHIRVERMLTEQHEAGKLITTARTTACLHSWSRKAIINTCLYTKMSSATTLTPIIRLVKRDKSWRMPL